MSKMVKELKEILLEAADDMKPSFHPNRWGFFLDVGAKSKYFIKFI